MTDKKISQFTDGGNLANSDVFPITRGAANFKIGGDKVVKTQEKDATGGVVGLTLFKINFKNALDTFTSFFTNSNTAARTYTFQDRDGVIADDTDINALELITLGFTNVDTVVVTHNLGKYPHVQVFEDSSGELFSANITHNSINQFTVSWNGLISGNIIYN